MTGQSAQYTRNLQLTRVNALFCDNKPLITKYHIFLTYD